MANFGRGPATSVNRNSGNFYVSRMLTASDVDAVAFIATRNCILRSIKEVHSVAGGASAAVRPRKVSGTNAPGAAVTTGVVELTTANIDLTSTANTVATPTLAASFTTRRFKSGDRIALDYSGTLTSLVGNITFEFEPV